MNENDVYRHEDLPGFIINQTAKLITDLLHKNFILANQEITPEQWIILDELWSNDGLTQLKIAQATFRQQTSTSRIIDNLVKRDLVYRSPNPLDKRSNLIYLTKRGKDLHQSLIKTVKQTMAHAVSEINEDELNNCLQVLNKISATISNK
ncbi:MarR family transcriptional regulator [Sporosarcina sp. P12(2017)]|uniref:MarR family winged helix-turn-helix transcriptional regulator n=1 Tax=unclassified Sporosarcina TaxID=2647733 RepID=UPI000C16DC14|nr:MULTISPECIES: MarR family transcriptional regulator [unclassified Sporosarcina]PIC56502.1 MarR family transcriptional regulator [Sporosarcina sp. P10]PIC60152.1 MarR family transcriptional regulator [Sporosarcina sp. P12(2017)]